MAPFSRSSPPPDPDEAVSISLPRDIDGLTEEITRIGAGALSVDPVISVLSNALDTHKDSDVRLGLEPLGRLADRTGCVVLGNAHFNKSSGSDPLSLIIGVGVSRRWLRGLSLGRRS
jgi:hypothetical protein